MQTLADLAGYGMACCALMVVNFVLLAWPGVRPTTELQLRRLTTLPVRVLRPAPPTWLRRGAASPPAGSLEFPCVIGSIYC